MADPRLAPVLSDPRKYRAQVLVCEVCPAAPSAGTTTTTTTTGFDDAAATPAFTDSQNNEQKGAGASASREGRSGGPPSARAMTTAKTLKRRGFRADAEYFYPASTVKLMGAVAACLKFQQIARQHDSSNSNNSNGNGSGGGGAGSASKTTQPASSSFTPHTRRLPRFCLDLDTPLVFEPRGLVSSIADSRAKTDRALRMRDRLIELAERRGGGWVRPIISHVSLVTEGGGV